MRQISRVTVFGGTGFIGRHVVRRLTRAGAIVTVISRHATKKIYMKPMGDVGQLTLVNGSVTNAALVEAAVGGTDLVVNLVGLLAESGTQRFDTVQAQAARTIGAAARKAGVARLVHLSAIGADPGSPSRYARSKAAGEMSVRAEFPDATILRPSIVFGPEDAFFNRFAQMAMLAPALPLIGGGKTRMQPVFVGDVADAVMAAAESRLAIGRTYELGGPRIYTFRELMELLLAEIDRADDADERAFRSHALIPIPFALASLMARFLPASLLTRDQVVLLRSDNIVADGALCLADLGIAATAPDLILPSYLARYRKGGWYSSQRTA